jgi:ABC-type molybdate transport system substrate-binding protein
MDGAGDADLARDFVALVEGPEGQGVLGDLGFRAP